MSRTDTAVRVISASPDRVFAALTESDALAVWLPPDIRGHRICRGRPLLLAQGRSAPVDASDARSSSPASVSSADIDAFAGNPRCAAGWNSTVPTSWRRTGRRTRVSSTAARPRNATPGRARGSSATWSRGHRWSGPRGSSNRASRCRGAARGPPRIRLRQPRRGRLVSARIHGDGRRVRTVRGRRLRAPFQLVRLPRGRVGVMIVARTSTGRTVVHTRRYRTCAR
jgi:hypothetical protein